MSQSWYTCTLTAGSDVGKIVVALYAYVPQDHVEEGEEDLAESELSLEPGG